MNATENMERTERREELIAFAKEHVEQEHERLEQLDPDIECQEGKYMIDGHWSTPEQAVDEYIRQSEDIDFRHYLRWDRTWFDFSSTWLKEDFAAWVTYVA